MCDAYEMWRAKERKEIQWLAKRPICYYCSHHIQDERVFVIDGKFFHVECAEEEFLKWTEDYIE